MSRLVTIFVALSSASPALAVTPAIPVKSTIEIYWDRTSADPDCKRNIKPDEIMVCGRREADKYRVPFILKAAGDPANEGLHAERERLQHITTPCDARGPFLVGCGMVGVSFSTRLGSGNGIEYRPLAP